MTILLETNLFTELVRSPAAPGDTVIGDAAAATNVQLFGIGDGEFDVVYERPGADQTVTLELDNPDSGVSLDRSNYPQNTDVVVTIDDQALNVDPTTEDSWYFADEKVGVYGTIVGLSTIANAATARDNNIRQDGIDRDALIKPVEFDNTEAKKRLDARTMAADVIIANALTTNFEKFELIQEYGQGLRNLGDDNIITTCTEDDEDACATAIDSIDSHYKGTALIAYEESAGTEDDVKLADGDFTAYAAAVGSDQVAYERVAGHGTMTVTPDTDVDHSAGDAYPPNYRGSAWIAYDIAVDDEWNTFNDVVSTAALPTTGVAGVETLDIDTNDQLECVEPNCIIVDGTIWIKFTEDGDNDSNFNNSPDDKSSLKTTSNAQRGLSFSVEYDNSATSGIGYSTTNIVIDAGDEWSSGEEIGITLTDSDANTNSLAANDLEVSNPDHTIPVIKIGDPLTLASDGTTISGVTGSTTTDGSERLMIEAATYPVSDTISDPPTDLLTITVNHGASAADRVTNVVNYDLSAFGDDASLTIDGVAKDLSGSYVVERNFPSSFVITFSTETTLDDHAIAIDIFSFGLDSDDDNVNNAIYRLELEEDGDDSSDFTGTLEYIGLNQINILEQSTYEGIDALGDSIILISDDNSISVEYRDLGLDRRTIRLFTAEADTPTHSGSVSLEL